MSGLMTSVPGGGAESEQSIQYRQEKAKEVAYFQIVAEKQRHWDNMESGRKAPRAVCVYVLLASTPEIPRVLHERADENETRAIAWGIGRRSMGCGGPSLSRNPLCARARVCVCVCSTPPSTTFRPAFESALNK